VNLPGTTSSLPSSHNLLLFREIDSPATSKMLRKGKIVDLTIILPVTTVELPGTTVEVKSFPCRLCDLHFPTRKLVFTHTQVNHPECKQCGNNFLDPATLQKHQQTTEHCYCHECSIHFPDRGAHVTHARSVTHTTLHHCCDCDREYSNQDTLSLHCCDCDKTFRSEKQMKRHLSECSNGDLHCGDCDKTFRSKKKLKGHLSRSKHIRKVEVLESEKARNLRKVGMLESEKARNLRKVEVLELETAINLPHKCKECDEAFQQRKQLKKHITLSHSHIQCPIGTKCRKFATPSALLNHLESGRCSSGITRTKIRELVFAHDTNRYVTSVEAADTIYCADNLPGNEPAPLPLLTDDGSVSEWSVVGGGLLTPTTSESDWSIIGRNALTPAPSDDASEWSVVGEDLIRTSSNTFPSDTNLEISSYNAQSQELRCYMCDPNRKPFRNIRAYQAHMSSAAHVPKIFHCPLSFMPQANQEGQAKIRYFSTLGGLTQHMESGRCDGGLELYSKAISFVEAQMKLLGLGDFKLLAN
jgi:hypothetical protein